MKRLLSTFIHRISAYFRRPASDPMAELRAALERQIEMDERARKRWGDHG